jgi:hypothetical protein
MDVVWICREGPNEELRYSIRSVVANMPHNKILVVGGKPSWYNGPFLSVETFLHDRKSSNKYVNAKNNIQHIIDSKEVSDEFIFMNDDFYVMQPLDKMPYFHGGLFSDKVERFRLYTGYSEYVKMLLRTQSVLNSLNIVDPLDYTLHVPITYHKNKLQEVLKYPGSIRTLYGNVHRVGGRQMEDVKIHPKRRKEHAPEPFDYKNRESAFLSTSDSVFNSVKKNLLSKVFTAPSRFESDH